jgi:hypothetical protein
VARKVFVISYTLILLVVTLASLADPLLWAAELVVGILLLSVMMSLLPRRFQQPVGSALPTSGTMQRRMDGLLTAVRLLKPRSSAADLAALRDGTWLYARAMRVDGVMSMVALLISAPHGEPVRLATQVQGTYRVGPNGRLVWGMVANEPVLPLPGPYTVSAPMESELGFIAKRGGLTETVELTGAGDDGMLIQLRPLDARLLRELAMLQLAEA